MFLEGCIVQNPLWVFTIGKDLVDPMFFSDTPPLSFYLVPEFDWAPSKLRCPLGRWMPSEDLWIWEITGGEIAVPKTLTREVCIVKVDPEVPSES